MSLVKSLETRITALAQKVWGALLPNTQHTPLPIAEEIIPIGDEGWIGGLPSDHVVKEPD